ncbi:MAG: hypothetical protein HWQ35_25805 [Nostoc sp. NMS1]|uniref:hypothetical protein n=1 Tax=unclassified Nostoc TaxID=2593658 RepID=UPI0025EE7EFD|nr:MULTISPECIES: hypothetical protein [unclassified Nostoc]MBN3909826.1 hypothetical protein [Nostoc sp. NMS1]MBN3994982.1 hypothetical protein [Nostoc sp. NMS2]
MAKIINGSDTFSSLPSQVDLDLLEALLEPDDATYPWNPADEESEAYFHELEQQFGMQDLLEEELTTRSQDFYSNLDTLWSNISLTSSYHDNHQQALVLNLQEALRTTFAACVPQTLLNTIAQKATEIFTAQQSMGEQLVECVQTVLPTWGTEDLLVLARPFAYAMRSSESKNAASAISNLNNSEWTALSEVEKAKVSLAIASYAFTQLNQSQPEV